ncbi:MAG: hypothetical protein ACRC6B_00335 [Fusobacteriaceae bacterium]
MKTLIIMGIVAVICYFAFESLYKTMTGKKVVGVQVLKQKDVLCSKNVQNKVINI